MTRRSFLKSLISAVAISTMPIGFIDYEGRERLLLIDDDGGYQTIPTVEEEITKMMADQFAKDLDREFINLLKG